MIEHLKEMEEAIQLETAYDWPLPANCPIEISAGTPFQQNVYLKENLASTLEQDNDLRHHFWIINDWGGIPLKKCDRNNALIGEFKKEIREGKLTRPFI